MKKFDVEFTQTISGVTSVEAKSPEAAVKKVEKMLESGIPFQDTFFTDMAGAVDAATEIEGE